ncbi:MAG: hypothetical protein BZY81_00155 [SAR202 cluster bacterium Io17-Chloro-G4]|nr:MAG: hypothetical protein BZY81_00155 [SAR202 cluster bacterium Io17-Chloro-G4]
MVKVSITLPNAAQITLESDESEVIQQVVSMALRDLPRELMQTSAGTDPANGQVEPPHGSSRAAGQSTLSVVDRAGSGVVERTDTNTGISGETGTPESPAGGASGLASGPAAATPGRTRTSRSATPGPTQTRQETAVPSQSGNQAAAATPAPTRVPTTESDNQFAQFCAAAAPLGDMRKVVVAAEGAKRLLGMPSVDATDLAGLFELAGWRIPHSFIQTLRNAARDKYRWLERVPGRSGRYTATDLGRTVTVAE